MISPGRKITITIIFDQMVVSGSNFIVGLLLARYLGADGYGQYVLAYGFILFVLGLQMALIVSPMMVKGPALPESNAFDYYKSLFIVQILFSVVVSLSVYLLAMMLNYYYHEWGLDSVLLELTIAIFSLLVQDFVRRYLISSQQFSHALLLDILFHGLRIFLIFLFAFYEQLDSSSAFMLLTISSILPLLIGITNIYRRKATLMTGKIPIVMEHWSFGKWLIVNNINYWFGSQLIIYMVGSISSVTSVGIMGATLNIVGIINILYLALQNIVPPRASRLHRDKGINGLNKYLIRVTVIGSILTFSVLFIAAMWSEHWISLLYKDRFDGFGWVVYWWAVYYFISFFHRPLNIGLRVLNNTKDIFKVNVLSPLITLTAGYYCITHHDIAGAMFALCLSNIVVLLGLFLMYRKSALKLNKTNFCKYE